MLKISTFDGLNSNRDLKIFTYRFKLQNKIKARRKKYETVWHTNRLALPCRQLLNLCTSLRRSLVRPLTCM